MDPQIRLVAGLGNPGETYARNRHNIGFRVVDDVSKCLSIPINRHKFGAAIGQGRYKGVPVILVKPLNYMNQSGQPVYRAAAYWKISVTEILVIHDDMDLDFGRLKIKQKGGDAGHKGIKSLIEALGGDNFVRLRMGVGRPEPEHSVVDYVLGDFNPDENKELDPFIERAREAVGWLLCRGTRDAMNQFNRNLLTH
jgi:PTH1 family peptidyl-tRNA hydrolase